MRLRPSPFLSISWEPSVKAIVSDPNGAFRFGGLDDSECCGEGSGGVFAGDDRVFLAADHAGEMGDLFGVDVDTR